MMFRYLAMLAAGLFSFLPANAQFYWDADGDGSAATGGSGNWDTTSLLWRSNSATGTLLSWPANGGDVDAYLGGTAGTLTLTTGISINDITVNPTVAGIYAITGSRTLTLNGTLRSVLDVAGGSTLTITAGFAGTSGFIKTNGGTLILDSAAGTGILFGDIIVGGGTLQAGSAVNNGASQVLRANAVNLAAGTTLTTVGTTIDLRVGSLSGSGSITPATGGAINELALVDSTFSGTITTTGGLNLRGGNGTTQIFNGNLTALTGTIGINSGATVRLAGTGSTSGVLGTTAALTTRGGTLVLDNSGGNTSAAGGRYGDGALVTLGGGGGLTLIGHSSGTTETVGAFFLNSGSSTITVNNGGGTGAVLAFTDTGSLRDSTAGTLNFIGLGGTLGSAGNNPRITFSGALNANTVNNALTSSASSPTSVTYGWARVNGTSWAGNSANGIVALAEVARNSATLGSAAANEITTFTPSATTTTLGAALGAPLTSLLLKITPSGSGQSLDSAGFNINASAVMLAGTTDFSITGTGSLFGTIASTRYVYTTDANTVFSISQSFAGANQPFAKSGPGTVFLNGAANQLGFTSAQSVNILEGTLRGTLTTLGGGTSAGGAFAQLNLYGGVLEISGGGNFSRALATGSATALGGTIKWDNGATVRGDGGFSAVGGNATVTLVTAIGGATQSAPVWDDTGFVRNGYALTMGSTKADSRIDFQNNIGLDNGSATANYFAREIRVIDNPGSANDVARLSGVISGSANADLLKTGDGVLELTGANTYSGNTIIQQGTLAVASGTAIGNSSAVILANTAGARFQLNSSETIGALSGGGTTGGNVALQTSTLTVGDQRDSTFGGVISSTSSAGALVKVGTGNLKLTNANTFTGPTTVNGGTLEAAATGALGGTSGLTVNSGGTLLLSGSGTDRLNDSATVTLAGGRIAFSGNVTEGTSPGIGALTLSADSIIDFAGGNAIINFSDSSLASWTGGTSLNIWNWDGAYAGGGNDQMKFGLDNTALTSVQLGQISFYSGSGIGFLGLGGILGNGEVVPVPEPATFIAPLTLVALLLVRNRRRFAALFK